MRGRHLSQTWTWDPTIYAPARYKKACTYDAFLPIPMANEEFLLPTHVAATISDGEQAILALNRQAQPALAPLARLLLRTESIASSKVEGLQVGIRQIAHAESRLETGGRTSASAREVIANIHAMQLAVDEASTAPRVTTEHHLEIHEKLMAGAANPLSAGIVRTGQNWMNLSPE